MIRTVRPPRTQVRRGNDELGCSFCCGVPGVHDLDAGVLALVRRARPQEVGAGHAHTGQGGGRCRYEGGLKSGVREQCPSERDSEPEKDDREDGRAEQRHEGQALEDGVPESADVEYTTRVPLDVEDAAGTASGLWMLPYAVPARWCEPAPAQPERFAISAAGTVTSRPRWGIQPAAGAKFRWGAWHPRGR